MRKLVFLAILAAAFVASNVLISFPPVSAKAQKFFAKTNGIHGRYIVVLNEDQLGSDMAPATVESNAQYLSSIYGGEVRGMYSSAVKGYVADMTAQQAEALSYDSNVQMVEQDGRIGISATQLNPGWHLDRVDQRNLPWDSSYGYSQNGAGVHAYILDTGIRVTHVDFGGRANVVLDVIGDGQNGNDCNGHGTHVAGIVGGLTYGVAKGVSLHAVRVLPCNGQGEISNVIAGIDWITRNRINPAVANISMEALGASPILETAVTNSIASGVTFAIAAGNDASDACWYTPGRTPNAITVAASDELDLRALYSNGGTCVDLFAPGNAVVSAGVGSDTASRVLSGSSMSAPMVAGAAAIYLQAHPSASPANVTSAILNSATNDVIDTRSIPTVNKLLYSWVNGAPAPTPTPTATPTPTPTATPTPSSTNRLKVTVKKRVQGITTGEVPATSFPYSAVNLSTANFALQSNQDYIDQNVQPSSASNPIVVTEASVDGFQLNSISCVDAAGGTANVTTDIANHRVSIVGVQDQQIECTFTSEQLTPTAAGVVLSGRVRDAYGQGIRGLTMYLTDPQTGETRVVRTNSFGIYYFADVEVGRTYVIEPAAGKRWIFVNAARTVTPTDNVAGLDFRATERRF